MTQITQDGVATAVSKTSGNVSRTKTTRNLRPAKQQPPSEPNRTKENDEGAKLFLTKEELRQKLNLPSTRSIDELCRRRVISSIRMGWRTIRFDLAAVLEDLEKVTVRAV